VVALASKGQTARCTTRNSGFDVPFEFDMCGIRFEMEGESFDLLRIFSVLEGSPAALAGIRQGDIVKRIDGRYTGAFTWESLRKYLRCDGETVRFTVKRGDEVLDIIIRLKRMV